LLARGLDEGPDRLRTAIKSRQKALRNQKEYKSTLPSPRSAFC
jgi:hypothetical protein